MSRYDAERALEIYKTFTKQTSEVVEYLQTARRLETSTRLQIPNLKHAPTSLTQSLEEYLHDPDFDINRRQYLAAQEAKQNAGKTPAKVSSQGTEEKRAPKSTAQSFPSPKTEAATPGAPAQQQQPKVAADLIDFFDSIENEQAMIFATDVQQGQQQQGQQQQFAVAQTPFPQATMVQQPFVQPMPQQIPPQIGDFGTYPSYSTGNFVQAPATRAGAMQQPIIQPVRTDFTGHGFGGYTPQDQNSVSVPPMPTVPAQYGQFRQPSIQQSFQHANMQQPFQTQPQQTSSPSLSIPMPGETNPFRQSMMMTGASPSSFASSPPAPKSTNPFKQATPASASPMSSFPTGVSTSPYATPPTIQPLRSATTGTNPFARNLATTQSPPVPPIPGSMTGGPSLLSVHATGTTNPFRASMMMQQQQQQQVNGQATGTIPGWENIETIPVFPRAN